MDRVIIKIKKMKKLKTNLLMAGMLMMGTAIYAQQPTQTPEDGSKSNLQQQQQSFLKKNPSVTRIAWKRGDLVLITSKSGGTTTYDLGNETSRNSFIKKYGTPPTPPPPPPARK